jgi:hypothetical protein
VDCNIDDHAGLVTLSRCCTLREICMTGSEKFGFGPLRWPGREANMQDAFGFHTDYNIDVIVALVSRNLLESIDLL